MRQLRLAFCHSPSDRLGHLALCQVALSDDGKPPEWIPLVPAGKKINALDGRKFSNSNPQAIVDAFNADPRDIAVDWEHSSEIRAPEGQEAPAAGWVVAMEVREGAVWGKVEWTPKGTASLETREYRYISPAFIFDKAKKVISEIVSAALTNRPALDMPAIARAGDDDPDKKTAQGGKATAHMEEIMDPKMLELLGLAEGATQEEINEAIAKLKVDPAAEVVELQKELETAKAKLVATEKELANAREANPELDKFVPRADYDAALARAKASETKIEEEAKASHQKEVDAEIEGALKAGKITPASKDFYVQTCAAEGGLEKFREFLKAAPVVGDPSHLENDPPPVDGDKKVATEQELAIAANCGLTKEQFLAGKID